MGKVTLNVVKNADGVVELYKKKENKAVTSVEIKSDQDMEIDVGSGFNAGALVSGFSLWTELDGGGKGTHLGTWLREAAATQPSTEISIAASSDTAILVTDTDSQVDEEKFFFCVQVTDGSANYETDPELKVKKVSN